MDSANNQNLIQILWVDDSIFEYDDMMTMALQNDMQLTQVRCWDAAKNKLVKSYDLWSAIIINPLTKLHGGSYSNPKQLLPNVFADLATLSEKNKRTIPWYILSSARPETFIDLIIESRNSFDGDWQKKYYDTNHDVKLLFSRIRYHVKIANRIAIQARYKQVYECLNYLEDIGLNTEVENNIEDLLLILQYQYDVSIKKCFDLIRLSIEYIFHSMVNFGLLPGDLRNDKGYLNITGCRVLLSGKDFISNNITFSPTHQYFDNVATKNLRFMLDVCNGVLHAEDESGRSLDTRHYFNVVQSHNLLSSCTLQLCDFIIYYAEVIKEIQNTNQYSLT